VESEGRTMVFRGEYSAFHIWGAQRFPKQYPVKGRPEEDTSVPGSPSLFPFQPIETISGYSPMRKIADTVVFLVCPALTADTQASARTNPVVPTPVM
jgi:hypothetical protein